MRKTEEGQNFSQFQEKVLKQSLRLFLKLPFALLAAITIFSESKEAISVD